MSSAIVLWLKRLYEYQKAAVWINDSISFVFFFLKDFVSLFGLLVVVRV